MSSIFLQLQRKVALFEAKNVGKRGKSPEKTSMCLSNLSRKTSLYPRTREKLSISVLLVSGMKFCSFSFSSKGNHSVLGRFLGNQRSSYNHDFAFSLRVGELGPQSGPMDVILEGGGLTVSTTIFGQGNQLPTNQVRESNFSFLFI